MPKWLRNILIVVLCLCAAGGGAYGILTVVKNRSAGAVNVYPAENLCMNYSWANQSETEGRVTTDKIQSVYISATQTVTEVYVYEGQTVSAGDPILAFDTTLSDLELERKRIEIDRLKLDIEEAEAERRAMDGYRVYSTTVQTEEEPEELTPVASMPWLRGGDGSAASPYIFLWNDLCAFDEDFINSVLPYLEGVPVPGVPSEEDDRTQQDSATDAVVLPEEESAVKPDGTEETDSSETTDAPEATAAPETTAAPEATAAPENTESPEDLEADPDPEATEMPLSTPSAEPELEDRAVYVVFEQRQEDSLKGSILRLWQMNFWRASDNTAVFTIVEPAADYDPQAAEDTDQEDTGYIGPAYTWSELQRMKREADQNILDLKFRLKQAELEYEIVEYELSSGVVYSKIDGVVKTLREADEALAMGEPMVLVSGGGGYYVQAVLGELDLDYMKVGDLVTVQSWESGETLQGEIVEISEYPQDEDSYSYYWSQGNSNISKYPFTIFLDEDAPLRENEYVYITFSRNNSGEESIYLENAFLRQENGQSYVYALGGDDRLEKRFVSTGGSLWSSYTEILGGLDPETDYLAFPYGRDVKEGAKTEIATIDELYGVYY